MVSEEMEFLAAESQQKMLVLYLGGYILNSLQWAENVSEFAENIYIADK